MRSGISNCAIFGGFGLTADQVGTALLSMGRGDHGITLEQQGPVWLGHRRHRILTDGKPGVPPGTSDQPYLSPEGSCALMFNGEVFSYSELRRELESRGHRFVSQGDTECLLAGYLEWGEALLSNRNLDSMFALAVADLARQCLLVARDWPGRVPLFFSRVGPSGRPGFLFSSEVRGLLTVSGLEHGHIEELAPGHCVHVDLQSRQVNVSRFFEPDRVSTPEDALSLGRRLKELLETACENRLMGDHLPCLLFSGGLDSLLTALCTLSAARKRGISARMAAYVFAVEGFDSEDVQRAQRAARHLEPLGMDLREVRTGATEIVEATPDLIDLFEPMRLQAVSFYPLPIYFYLARRIAEDGFMAAIGGDGPDELLGAYDMWKELDLKREEIRSYERRRWLIDGMHETILKRGSIMMMERGPVEMRFPFLQTRTAEFLLSVPPPLLDVRADTARDVFEAFTAAKPFEDRSLGEDFRSYLKARMENRLPGSPRSSGFDKLFWKLPLLMAGLLCCIEMDLAPDILMSPKLRSQHGAGLTSLEPLILERYKALGASSDAALFRRIWEMLFYERLSPQQIRDRTKGADPEVTIA